MDNIDQISAHELPFIVLVESGQCMATESMFRNYAVTYSVSESEELEFVESSVSS